MLASDKTTCMPHICRLTQELDLAQHGVQLAQSRIESSEEARLAAGVDEAKAGLQEAAEAAKQTAKRQADLISAAQVTICCLFL